METMIKERPILFSGPMVQAILAGRKIRRKLYVSGGSDRNAESHIANRLANGLDSAEDGQCWEWMRTISNRGYGKLTVKGRGAYAHRLAFELGSGSSIPDGVDVCHRCDNPRCINPSHLFIGSRSDNMKDCFQKGRSSVLAIESSFPGERNPSAKLTSSDVVVIRELLTAGITQAEIALRFGVSQAQISNIKRGKSWL